MRFRLASNGYMSSGFEMAVELTFPVKENTCNSILISFSQFAGTICACLGGIQLRAMGVFWSLMSFNILLAVGTIITFFVPNEKRRQAVLQGKSINNDEFSGVAQEKIPI